MKTETNKAITKKIYRIVQIKKRSQPYGYKVYLEEAISPKVRRKGESKIVTIDLETYKNFPEVSVPVLEEYLQIAIHNKHANMSNTYFSEQVELVKSMGRELRLTLRDIERTHDRKRAMEERRENASKRSVIMGQVHLKKALKKRKERDLAQYFRHFYKQIQDSKVVDYNFAISGLNKLYDCLLYTSPSPRDS